MIRNQRYEESFQSKMRIGPAFRCFFVATLSGLMHAVLMNIAIISYYHPLRKIEPSSGSKGGGMGVFSLNLSIELARQGNMVTLVLGSDDNRKQSLSANLNIEYVKTIKFPFDTRIPQALFKKLAQSSYDVIHVHQFFTSFSFISCVAGRLRKVPCIVTDHGGGENIWRAIHVPLARSVNAFAAVSEFSLRSLLRLGPSMCARKNSRVVYGGVDPTLFHPDYNVEHLKQELDLDRSRVILAVGRLLPQKGVDVLIRALGLLPSDTRLLVVGAVYDREYFRYLVTLSEKMFPRRVIFLGEVEAEKLAELYNICDVFVQSSVYYDYKGRHHPLPELLGLTKLEAMACRKPVIVSDVGGLPELIVDGKNGYVFSAGDKKELAQKLHYLLENDEARKKIGQEGFSLVNSKFTWKAVAKRVINIYRDTLD